MVGWMHNGAVGGSNALTDLYEPRRSRWRCAEEAAA